MSSVDRSVVRSPSGSARETQGFSHNGFAYPLGVLLADGKPRDLTAEGITQVQTHPKTRTEVDRPLRAETDGGCVKRPEHVRAPVGPARELSINSVEKTDETGRLCRLNLR
ncbi:MAG: hypothetical protein HY735_37170 [Verrucomicrobia bacterium]|nr:hypothetical protein [Verrucomicrobiota bacterium]